MFDCFRSILFEVTVRCVRAKAYVHPRVSDDVVIIVIFKRDIIYLYTMNAQRTVLCFVSCTNDVLFLLLCKRPECQM